MKRLYEMVLDQFSVRTMRLLCLAILAVAAVAVGNDVMSAESATFGGQEVAEAHITSDGLLRVVSRVSITRCPANVTYLPIHLPQEGARLESVVVGGRSVAFKSWEGVPEADPNTHYAMPSLPEKAFRDALVEVTWSIPLADMPTEAGTIRFPLQSLIPTKDFAVNVVIDEGARYVFGGKFSGVNDFNIFWSKRDRYVGGVIGSCGIELVPRAS